MGAASPVSDTQSGWQSGIADSKSGIWNSHNISKTVQDTATVTMKWNSHSEMRVCRPITGLRDCVFGVYTAVLLWSFLVMFVWILILKHIN